MSSGKIYAILFYSNDDLVLHFESITSEWLSMANFDEWNPKLIQFINQKQSYEPWNLNLNPISYYCPPLFCTKFIIGDIVSIFCHEQTSYNLLATIWEVFTDVFHIVTDVDLSLQILESQIDLCYDLLRRILQFGSIHQLDRNKLSISTIYNPKNQKEIAKVPSKSSLTGWFSNSFSKTEVEEMGGPELTFSILEEISFDFSKEGANCRLLGKLILNTSKIPSMSKINISLEKTENFNPKICFGEHLEVNHESNSYSINGRLPLSSNIIGEYQLQNFKVPITLNRKIRSRETDKLVELQLDLQSNLPQNVRISNLSISINLPFEYLNARSCSDHVGHSFEIEEQIAFWKIGSIFGGSKTSTIISIAVSEVTSLQQILLSQFTVSFQIENYSFSRFQVQTFRLLSPNGTSIKNVKRKIRECIISNSSKIVFN